MATCNAYPHPCPYPHSILQQSKQESAFYKLSNLSSNSQNREHYMFIETNNDNLIPQPTHHLGEPTLHL
jgi:hypothetical protein